MTEMWIDLKHGGNHDTGYGWQWVVLQKDAAGFYVVSMYDNETLFKTRRAANKAAEAWIAGCNGKNMGDWSKR